MNTTMSLVSQLSQTSDCLNHFSVTICEAAWRLFGTEVARWTGDVYMLSGLVDRVDDSFDEMMNALSLVLCEVNDCTSRPTADCTNRHHTAEAQQRQRPETDYDFLTAMRRINEQANKESDAYVALCQHREAPRRTVEAQQRQRPETRKPKNKNNSKRGWQRGNDDDDEG